VKACGIVPWAVAASLAAFGADAAADDEPFYVQEGSKWGAIARVADPVYPAVARAQRITGYVDVEGTIDKAGHLTEVTYTPDREQSAVFIEPLKAVLPEWFYSPALGNDCLPSTGRVRSRVWFDLEGDNPRIRTTQRTAGAKANRMAVTRRITPRFPRGMDLREVEVNVYVRSQVDRYGHVVATRGTAFSNRMASDELNPFEHECEMALRYWRYTPAAEGDPDTRTSCVEIAFHNAR